MCRCCIIFSLGILTCGSGPLQCMAFIFRKKKKKFRYQFRLVNAMHRNGPLTQVNPGPNTAKKINEVKAKLEGVDYIFIDEVSMMSCQDMYKISAQLAKALNISHLPYGGINIIFAGDFAQLPPVGGASLFSQAVGTQVHASLSLAGQESAIGKALWHQVTTVVILRQNMRQKNSNSTGCSVKNCTSEYEIWKMYN